MLGYFKQKLDDPETLGLHETTDPSPKKSELLIKINASGINRIDLYQKQFKQLWDSDQTKILGVEFAGEVLECGSEAKSLIPPGKRVFSITPHGAHADFICMDPRALALIPEGVSYLQASSIPEAYLTSHDAISRYKPKSKLRTVYINAVGSSVGLACLAICRNLNLETIGSSRSDKKMKEAYEFGLDKGFTIENDADEIRGFFSSSGRKIDLFIDLLGGQYLEKVAPYMNTNGVIVSLGGICGINSNINLWYLMNKRLKIVGSVMRSRTLKERIRLMPQLSELAIEYERNVHFRIPIYRTIPFNKIDSGIELINNNLNFGKIVIDHHGNNQ